MKIIATTALTLLLSSLVFAAATPPVITAISPVQGIIQYGGATISVMGTNFKKGEYVMLCRTCFGDEKPRSTQFVNSTQLLVALLPGDLSQPTIWSPAVVNGPANSGSPTFLWAVTDGTINISPGDLILGLNDRVQFSATSTIPGDAIQWSLYSPYSFMPSPTPTIDQTGLFTAPSSPPTNLFYNFQQMGVYASSTLDPSKSSLVMVTIQ